MNDSSGGFSFELGELARAVSDLSPRSTAAVFGVCAAALAPLLNRVEERSEYSWTVPELPRAISLIEAFATGSAVASHHFEERRGLSAEVPARHPWRTYAQDALICADAGLGAVTGKEHPDPRLIHSALEPLIVWAEERDHIIIRTYGEDHWDREIVNDPPMAKALNFLRRMISTVSLRPPADSLEFRKWITEAAVLRPVEN